MRLKAAAAMGEARPAKVRRLFAGVGLSRNHSQVSDLLQRLRRADEEDREFALSCNRYHMQRALDDLWRQTSQEEVFEASGGQADIKLGTISWPKVVRLAAETAPGYASLLNELWRKQPCTADSPYHLVCYGDEFVPGNVLRQDNRRKCFGMFVTIREFGPYITKHVEAWLPIVCVRSSLAKDIKGGVSNVVRKVFRRMFLVDKISEQGVLLPLGAAASGTAAMYFKLGNLVLDGDAARIVFSTLGANAKLPCMNCLNVLQARTPEMPRRFVGLDCSDPTLFARATNEDIWQKADEVSALPPARLKEGQTARGIKCVPGGLLFDCELRPHCPPIDTSTHDAMHILNGMACTEMSLLLTAMFRHPSLSWGSVRAWMDTNWKFCGAFSGAPAELKAAWNVARETAFGKHKEFKAGASELIMIIPVFGYFLECVAKPRGILEKEIRSFAALALIYAFVKEGKFGRDLRATASGLDAVFAEHAKRFNDAYPGAGVIPKGHWGFHLAPQLLRDGYSIDCFVGERQNSIMKDCAQSIKNTRSLEKSILTRVLADRLGALADPGFFLDRLQKPESSPALARAAGASSASLSTSMKFRGTALVAGDAVWCDRVVCMVVGCASVDSDFALLCDEMVFVEQVSAAASRWKYAPGGAHSLLRLADCEVSLSAGFFWDGDTVVVLAW